MTQSFAVMGDTHLVREASHWKALHGCPGGPTELSDLERNGWMTRNVLPQILKEIAGQHPDFILHTGDIIPGHCDDDEGQLAEMRQALQVLAQAGAPLYFSCGSHDGVPGRKGEVSLRECLYPYMAHQLGRPCSRGYYAFERCGCRFIALDYTAWDRAQYEFLEQALQNSAGQFVIVFGHPPVVPLARPFFTGAQYARDLAALFSRWKVDVYFCGHTHNQAASLHRFGPHETAQLMSTPLGYPDSPPVLLSDVRPLLPAEGSCRYGWGFLEDTMPGWWRVSVAEDLLTAQWYVLGRGLQGELRIPRGKRAEFSKIPQYSSTEGALPDAEEIAGVRLRAAGSGSPTVTLHSVEINGVRLPCGISLAYFDSRQFLELPPEVYGKLRRHCTIRFAAPDEGGTIGGFVLEVRKKDGSWIRSSVSPYYTSNPAYAAADPAHFYRTDHSRIETALVFRTEGSI